MTLERPTVRDFSSFDFYSNSVPKKIIDGVYLGVNSDLKIWFKDLHSTDVYGVCDNAQQILDHHPVLASSDKHFVVGLVEHRKEWEGEEGWRWHKWGSYIGTKKPQAEYLIDEPDIEIIYSYNVYEIREVT